MTGRDVPRNDAFERPRIGESIEREPSYSGLRRGDLMLWKGHAATMSDAENKNHANGHTMNGRT